MYARDMALSKAFRTAMGPAYQSEESELEEEEEEEEGEGEEESEE
jgi:hypothetical protein